MIHRLGRMIGSPQVGCRLPNGLYVRAVPEPFFGGLFDRLRDAAAIIRGDAYAVRWPEAGELEAALADVPFKPTPRKEGVSHG